MSQIHAPRRSSVLSEAMAKAMSQIVDPLLGDDGVDRSLIENNHELQVAELERCRSDVIYFSENYVYCYDPRLEPPLPRESLFIPYPRQREMLLWALDRRAKKQVGAIPKARDSGVSIAFGCVLGLHSWLFENGSTIGYGSYQEDKLDRLGDMSSLFEKIRFCIRRLPSWMKPPGFNEQKHLLHKRLINPANGSVMIAEVGDQCGRGGRCTFYVADEFSFLEHPDLVDASLVANTNVIFYVSTPNGIGNLFYRKCASLPPEQVFTFRWIDDPRKTPEWKDKIIKDFGLIVFEREYNLNFAASLEGICIPSEWARAAVNLPLPEIGDMVIGFDVAAEGDNLNSMAPRRGPVVRPLKTWQGLNTTQSAHIAAKHAEELGAVRVFFDGIGIGNAIKGIWDTMVADQEGNGLPFEPISVTGGEQPSDFIWPDGKNSKQKFVNVRAEMWWLLRCRFHRTFEYVQWLADKTKGAYHDPETLISIPDDEQLIAELSTPLITYARSGKMQLESKIDMRKRGIRSPDKADSLAYTEYPKAQRRPFWFR